MATTPHRDERLTYDDFLCIPDDGLRHEIIDGVHYVTPSPIPWHQVLIGCLHLALGTFLEAQPHLGHVFLSPLDTVITPWDVVEPDLLVVTGDQSGIVTEPNIQGAPALVIEVLSPSTRRRDLGIKRDLFDRGGVREYWVVDPTDRSLTVYRRAADGALTARPRLMRDEGDVLTTPLLPEFALSLARLFRPLTSPPPGL